MKYRITVEIDDINCYACDCSLYHLQKLSKLFYLFPYWEHVRTYYANEKEQAYQDLNKLNNE